MSWSRRRPSSMRSRPRWPRRSSDAAAPATELRWLARHPGSISTPPACSTATGSISPIPNSFSRPDTASPSSGSMIPTRLAACPMMRPRKPADEVIGVDFSGGLAGVVAALNARFNGQVMFSGRAAPCCRFLDDGAANNSRSMRPRRPDPDRLRRRPRGVAVLHRCRLPIPAAITANGSQSIGLAGRISVNSRFRRSLEARRVSGRHAAGDATRPNFILVRLTDASLAFSPGPASAPRRALSGSLAPLHASGDQRPGRSRRQRAESGRRPGRGGQRLAAAFRGRLRGQYRRGDGQPAHPGKAYAPMRA